MIINLSINLKILTVMKRLIVNQAIENPVNENELDEIYGGGSGESGCSFSCSVNFADEDNDDNVVF